MKRAKTPLRARAHPAYPDSMMKIAVFDLDGTLVDSAADIHAALDRLMAARGLPGFARPEVVAMIGDGVRVLVTRALAARALGARLGDSRLARLEHRDVLRDDRLGRSRG